MESAAGPDRERQRRLQSGLVDCLDAETDRGVLPLPDARHQRPGGDHRAGPEHDPNPAGRIPQRHGRACRAGPRRCARAARCRPKRRSRRTGSDRRRSAGRLSEIVRNSGASWPAAIASDSTGLPRETRRSDAFDTSGLPSTIHVNAAPPTAAVPSVAETLTLKTPGRLAAPEMMPVDPSISQPVGQSPGGEPRRRGAPDRPDLQPGGGARQRPLQPRVVNPQAQRAQRRRQRGGVRCPEPRGHVVARTGRVQRADVVQKVVVARRDVVEVTGLRLRRGAVQRRVGEADRRSGTRRLRVGKREQRRPHRRGAAGAAGPLPAGG